MSEEEKKAIDILKRVILVGNFESYNSEGIIIEAIKTILNLLDKQQNEIASQEKQIKLMQNCDLAKVIKEQEKEIKQKDIMNEALKNAIGNILQGKKLCKEIKGGTTIRINLIKEKEKRIENALLYLKTMEESEDTYELEKILKGE